MDDRLVYCNKIGCFKHSNCYTRWCHLEKKYDMMNMYIHLLDLTSDQYKEYIYSKLFIEEFVSGILKTNGYINHG